MSSTSPPSSGDGILSVIDRGSSLAHQIVPTAVPGMAAPMVPAPKSPLNIKVKKMGPDTLKITDTRGTNTIDYLMNRFYVGPENTPFTSMSVGFGLKDPMGVPIGMKAGIDKLAGVKDSLYEMIKKLNPDTLAYSAGAPNLGPLYDRVTNRLAKDFNAKAGRDENGDFALFPAYKVQFPNKPSEGSDPALNTLLDKFFKKPTGSF